MKSVLQLLCIGILNSSFAQVKDRMKEWNKFDCDSGNCKNGEGKLIAQNKFNAPLKRVFKGNFEKGLLKEGEVVYLRGTNLISSFKGVFKNGDPSDGVFCIGAGKDLKLYVTTKEYVYESGFFLAKDSVDVKLSNGCSFYGKIRFLTSFGYFDNFSLLEGRAKLPDGSVVKIKDAKNNSVVINYTDGRVFEGSVLDPFLGKYEPTRGTMRLTNGDTFEGKSWGGMSLQALGTNGTGKYKLANGDLYDFYGPMSFLTGRANYTPVGEKSRKVWCDSLEVIAEEGSPLYKKLITEEDERIKKSGELIARIKSELKAKEAAETKAKADYPTYCVVFSLVKKSISFGNASTSLTMVFIHVDDLSKSAPLEKVKSLAEIEFSKNINMGDYKLENIQLVNGDCRTCKKEILKKGVVLKDFRIFGLEIKAD